jgi:uncharacterized protein TIGR03905
MRIDYKPEGICATKIVIDLKDDVIDSIKVVNGCPGNLLGLSALLKGMNTQEAIERLEGIRCRDKQTSCPDQIARALRSV